MSERVPDRMVVGGGHSKKVLAVGLFLAPPFTCPCSWRISQLAMFDYQRVFPSTSQFFVKFLWATMNPHTIKSTSFIEIHAMIFQEFPWVKRHMSGLACSMPITFLAICSWAIMVKLPRSLAQSDAHFLEADTRWPHRGLFFGGFIDKDFCWYLDSWLFAYF